MVVMTLDITTAVMVFHSCKSSKRSFFQHQQAICVLCVCYMCVIFPTSYMCVIYVIYVCYFISTSYMCVMFVLYVLYVCYFCATQCVLFLCYYMCVIFNSLVIVFEQWYKNCTVVHWQNTTFLKKKMHTGSTIKYFFFNVLLFCCRLPSSLSSVFVIMHPFQKNQYTFKT